jgi:hypothetical protein
MNNNNLFMRFELLFWNVIIRSLSSSRILRTSVQKIYAVTHSLEAASIVLLIVFTGLAGLVSGYMFYYVTVSLR